MNIMIAGSFLPTRELDGEIFLEVTTLISTMTEEKYDHHEILSILEEELGSQNDHYVDHDSEFVFCNQQDIRDIFDNIFDSTYDTELTNLFQNIENHTGPMLQLNFNGTLLENLEATMENGTIQISDGLETVSLAPTAPVGPFLRYQGQQISVKFRGTEVLYLAQSFLSSLFHYEVNEREVHHFVINRADNPPADIEYDGNYYMGLHSMLAILDEMGVDPGYKVVAGRIFRDFGINKEIGRDYDVWGQ